VFVNIGCLLLAMDSGPEGVQVLCTPQGVFVIVAACAVLLYDMSRKRCSWQFVMGGVLVGEGLGGGWVVCHNSSAAKTDMFTKESIVLTTVIVHTVLPIHRGRWGPFCLAIMATSGGRRAAGDRLSQCGCDVVWCAFWTWKVVVPADIIAANRGLCLHAIV
jgi:hypothetical protein